PSARRKGVTDCPVPPVTFQAAPRSRVLQPAASADAPGQQPAGPVANRELGDRLEAVAPVVVHQTAVAAAVAVDAEQLDAPCAGRRRGPACPPPADSAPRQRAEIR